MGTSVRAFSRAHPSPDTSYTLVLDRLDGAILRIEELAKQQEGGYVSKHSAVVRRSDLRRRLRSGLLRHVVTAAKDAGEDAPAIAERFRLPGVERDACQFPCGCQRDVGPGPEQPGSPGQARPLGEHAR